MSIKTGRFQSIDQASGLWVVQVDQNGRVIQVPPMVYGGNDAGLSFTPTAGDIVVLDAVDDIYAIVLTVQVQHSKKIIPPTGAPGYTTESQYLNEGEVLLYGRAGQKIYMDSKGSIWLLPNPLLGKIYLGNPENSGWDLTSFQGVKKADGTNSSTVFTL